MIDIILYLLELIDEQVAEARLGFHCEFCSFCQLQTCNLAGNLQWKERLERQLEQLQRKPEEMHGLERFRAQSEPYLDPNLIEWPTAPVAWTLVRL